MVAEVEAKVEVAAEEVVAEEVKVEEATVEVTKEPAETLECEEAKGKILSGSERLMAFN